MTFLVLPYPASDAWPHLQTPLSLPGEEEEHSEAKKQDDDGPVGHGLSPYSRCPAGSEVSTPYPPTPLRSELNAPACVAGCVCYAEVVECVRAAEGVGHNVSARDPPALGRRLRRALDTSNPTIALAAAAELDYVGLSDALELVLLVLDTEPNRVSPAALRWQASRRIVGHMYSSLVAVAD